MKKWEWALMSAGIFFTLLLGVLFYVFIFHSHLLYACQDEEVNLEGKFILQEKYVDSQNISRYKIFFQAANETYDIIPDQYLKDSEKINLSEIPMNQTIKINAFYYDGVQTKCNLCSRNCPKEPCKCPLFTGLYSIKVDSLARN